MIKNEKAKSNFFNISPNFLLQHDLSTNDTNKTGNRKSSFNKISSKELNIHNFIKHKHKFYISNFFDEKQTKEFLESKEIALKEIKLNDIIENYKNKDDKPNSISKIKKITFKSEKGLKRKISKGKSISPRKRKIKKINYFDKKNENDGNSCNIFNTANNCEKDSNDDNYIYKFIIDNVDESEDNFHQKLQKEIKRVESIKYNLTKQSKSNIGRTFTSNKKSEKKSLKVNLREKSDAKLNLFTYSETTKNLMVVEDIEVSSINDDVSLSPRKKRKILAALKEKNASTNKDLLNDAKLDVNNNSIEINSSHESLMSILSGLI